MNERGQVECVFGLGGGELADRPWAVISADGPNRDTLSLHAGERQLPYWYEGAPEHVESTFKDEIVRTVVTCELYGSLPEWLLEHDGSVWRRQVSYTSSGEAECLGRMDGDHCKVTAEHVDATGKCVLCDEALNEPHGFVYLGDAWAEIIYKLEVPD